VSSAGDVDLIAGAGTHRDTHTAAVCDGRGRVLSQLKVPATPDGYGELLAWARATAAGRRLVQAVEGTRHYGLGLARHLAAAGQQVAGTGSTPHAGKRRAGKSDPIDAVRAARELLARPRPGQMRADGDREALRLLMIDRDNAVQSGKTARTVLTSVIVTAPAQLREELRHLPAERRARACAALACPRGADQLTRVVHQTLIRLGQRATALAEVADDLEAQISAIAGNMARLRCTGSVAAGARYRCAGTQRRRPDAPAAETVVEHPERAGCLADLPDISHPDPAGSVARRHGGPRSQEPAKRGRGVRGKIKARHHKDATPLEVALRKAVDNARCIGGRWLEVECRAVRRALLCHAERSERDWASECCAENLAY
jgi:hypothetical protein